MVQKGVMRTNVKIQGAWYLHTLQSRIMFGMYVRSVSLKVICKVRAKPSWLISAGTDPNDSEGSRPFFVGFFKMRCY